MSKGDKVLTVLICIYIISLSIIPLSLKVNFGDVLLLLVITFYLGTLIFIKSERQNFKIYICDFFQDRFSQFMMALAFIMFISYFYSLDKIISIKESIRFSFYILLFFIIKYEMGKPKTINLIIISYAINALILGSIGIYQYLTGWSLKGSMILESLNQLRIASTLENPNSFGGYLILIIFPMIMLSIKEKKIIRLLYVIISILSFINLILTLSRGAWLGFVIGCAALSIVYNWKFIFSYIIIGILSLFIPQISGRIKEFADMSQNAGRIKLWKIAFKMIQDNPILGIGNGNYVSRYDEYSDRYPELNLEFIMRSPSHNSYLKVFSELGIIGISIFMSIIVLTFKNVNKTIKLSNGIIKYFHIGFIASMTGFYVMNIFDNLFFVPKVASYFWIIIAVSQGIIYEAKSKKCNL